MLFKYIKYNMLNTHNAPLQQMKQKKRVRIVSLQEIPSDNCTEKPTKVILEKADVR